jgi:hypothetical protein
MVSSFDGSVGEHQNGSVRREREVELRLLGFFNFFASFRFSLSKCEWERYLLVGKFWFQLSFLFFSSAEIVCDVVWRELRASVVERRTNGRNAVEASTSGRAKDREEEVIVVRNAAKPFFASNSSSRSRYLSL